MGHKIITRFAPSPTGYLHLGHAHSALFAAEKAKEARGTFLLRIEDIDPTRCREEFVNAIEEDLTWLGLDFLCPVRRQSAHMRDYTDVLERLKAMELLYPCFCTRKDIAAEIAAAGHAPHAGPDGLVYPGTCRDMSVSECRERLSRGDQHSWRLDMKRAVAMAGPLAWHDALQGEVFARPEDFGDVVLARKETPASYHLCVTVDDALQGVTLVTRGKDLFRSTDIHRLLQKLLDYPVPHYAHHEMLLDEQGTRLAKRDGAKSIRDYRGEGASPDEVRAWAGFPAASRK